MPDTIRYEDGAPLAATAAGAWDAPPSHARFSLRLRPGDGLPAIAGLPLALPVNRSAGHGSWLMARLGPDEWFLKGPHQEGEVMAAEAAARLEGRFFALADISHRHAAFAVNGPHAAAVLNAGCALDLHLAAFPPGAAARTLLGKAEILLLRAGEMSFSVECWRSFGPYVRQFLATAAAFEAALAAR